MSSPKSPKAKPKQRLQSQISRINPLLVIACGLALITGAGITYSLEPGDTDRAAVPDAAMAAEQMARIRERNLKKAREREALARAELERQAAEEAAERARRVSMMADAASEVQARHQREEMTRQQAAVEEAHRAATEAEAAWKRFYRPSAACRDQAAGATVECVNEYVRAKREFEAQRAVASAR